MLARHDWFASPAMGRNIHMWTYGHAGRPVLVFPTAGGYAHEWQQNGAIDAISDLIDAGRIRLYCPETNVAEVWTHATADLRWRMKRHAAYERFVTEELLPRIWRESGRRDLIHFGASVGAMYAVNFSLKYPRLFPQGIALSGRYQAKTFTDGADDLDVYYSNPLDYAWNLHGDHLEEIRRNAHLTLVCGQGNFEGNCLAETRELARALEQKGVPLWNDIWGADVSHEWVWWHRQIRFHLLRRRG
jgi:esterase/lipase superfamily enzyme